MDINELLPNMADLEAISKDLVADIIVYSGSIDRSGAEKLIRITQKPDNKNVLFILCTPGGNAGEAFKIARRLQEKYSHFYLYVYGYCKSAGTLIAIGSDEIIMGEYAEFGPLDVQLPEKDEIWRYSSGLSIDEALRTLRSETLHFFHTTLIELVRDAGISTKTAAKLATDLALGFITPIISQIEPVRVGEIRRAIKIALAYGERLIVERGNLKVRENLVFLVQEYPDHGFVIDYKEASAIFKNIRKNNEIEEKIGKHFKRPHQNDCIVEKIYPWEQKDEQPNKQANAEGVGENQREARAANSPNSGEALQ